MFFLVVEKKRRLSRNLQDMSEMFPELYAQAKKLGKKDFVAEGEAIAYDIETGTFLPFQETVKRRRKYDIETMAKDVPLKLFLFDLLYIDGKSLLDLTHKQRRKKMVSIFKGQKIDIIAPLEEVTIKTAKELEKYFDENIASGLEGLVVKKPDSVYQPGKRNFNWIKLKRQETGHLDDTIDCVILGYYAGHGRRASFGIGALLVGVYNKKEDRFETIAKIGTGLSDAQWKAQKKSCDKISVKIKPKNVVCAKELVPDVWVSPDIVALIRADEITLSPLHSAGETKVHSGYALRFPRLMGYRDDKSAREATTVKEIKALYAIQFKGKTRKKKKKSKRVKGQRSIF
jgi:DNA ligase-1